MELTTTPQQSGMMQVATSRQAQEIQSAMVIAQRFPRDTNRSYTRIIEDCKRKTLAEKSVYAYPRGGTTVTGPSIRLAECMARAWGNLDFGIVELERKPAMGSIPGESVIQAYCYDLETNTKSTTVFTVRHARDKNITVGGVKKKIQEQLTDERDIYEMVANQGARRLRARILAIIPVDIVETAVNQCRLTMKGGQGPLIDRVRNMLVAFKAYGVTQEMVEKYLGHTLEATNEDELVDLINIGNSLKDGAASREDFFEMPQVEEKTEVASEEKKEAPEQEQKLGKKTKSIKNFAPQSAEGAKTHKPGDHTVIEKEVSPEQERAEAIRAVLDTQKELKMDNKSLASFVETYFKKKTNDLSLEELQTLHAELLAMKQP